MALAFFVGFLSGSATILLIFLSSTSDKFKVGDKLQRYSNEFSENYYEVKRVGSHHYLLNDPKAGFYVERQYQKDKVNSEFFKVKA